MTADAITRQISRRRFTVSDATTYSEIKLATVTIPRSMIGPGNAVPVDLFGNVVIQCEGSGLVPFLRRYEMPLETRQRITREANCVCALRWDRFGFEPMTVPIPTE